MYEDQKLTVAQAREMDWKLLNCKITSCHAGETKFGYESTVHGYATLAVRDVRIRFNWNAKQLTPFRAPTGPLNVDQDYLTVPQVEGYLLSENDGRKADYESELRLAQAVVNKTKGKWSAKVRHIVRLSRW